MTVRVGINGFGRIGRNFFRAAKQRVSTSTSWGHDRVARDVRTAEYYFVPHAAQTIVTPVHLGLRRRLRVRPSGSESLPWSTWASMCQSDGIFTQRDTVRPLEGVAPLVIVSAP